MFGLNDGRTFRFGNTISKLSSFTVAGSGGIDYDILERARDGAEEVEYRDSVINMSLDKRVVHHPYFPDVGDACQPCRLHRVSDLVVPEVETLERKEPFYAGDRTQPVCPEVERGDGRQRVFGQ